MMPMPEKELTMDSAASSTDHTPIGTPDRASLPAKLGMAESHMNKPNANVDMTDSALAAMHPANTPNWLQQLAKVLQ